MGNTAFLEMNNKKNLSNTQDKSKAEIKGKYIALNAPFIIGKLM